MVILPGTIEITQDSLRRLPGLLIATMQRQMLLQFLQRAALRPDAPVTGFQHLQRVIESGGGCAAKQAGHVGPLNYPVPACATAPTTAWRRR